MSDDRIGPHFCVYSSRTATEPYGCAPKSEVVDLLCELWDERIRIETVDDWTCPMCAMETEDAGESMASRLRLYYVASLKHTEQGHSWITFWRPNNANYAWPMEWSGRYSERSIRERLSYYNNGLTTVAVRSDVVRALAIPAVVDNHGVHCVPNTRFNWETLLAPPSLMTRPPTSPEPQYPGAPRRSIRV